MGECESVVKCFDESVDQKSQLPWKVVTEVFGWQNGKNNMTDGILHLLFVKDLVLIEK